MRARHLPLLLLAPLGSLTLTACSAGPGTPDAGPAPVDAGPADAGRVGPGPSDAGAPDGGAVEAGQADAGLPEGSPQPPGDVRQSVRAGRVVVSWEPPAGGPGVVGYRPQLVGRLQGRVLGEARVEPPRAQLAVDAPPGEWVRARVTSMTARRESEPGLAKGWVAVGPYAYAARVPVPLATRAGLGVGDFDGDGRLDVALTGANLEVLVYPGRGDGTLGEPVHSPVLTRMPDNIDRRLGVGDVDGDGRLDLLLNGRVLWGRGGGSFVAGPDAPPPGPAAHWRSFETQWALGDLDGDGRADVLAAQPGRLLAWLALPDAGLAPPVASAPPDAGAGVWAEDPSLALADFDRDGRADVAVRFGDRLRVGLGDGQGGFALGAPWTVRYYHSRTGARDVDRDGCPDVTAGELLLRGGCDGGFALAPPGAVLDVLGDFDGDGRVDSAGWAGFAFGDGTGAFARRSDWTEVYCGQQGPVVAADLDGDGKDDLVCLQPYLVAGTTEGDLVVVLSR